MNLPPFSLHHLHGLTDATGMIQHAPLSIPDRHSGHTGEDNSRALVAGPDARRGARRDGALEFIPFLASVALIALVTGIVSETQGTQETQQP